MPDELDDTITENAAGPQMVQQDETTVKQHSLRDQIEADRYLASKRAARKAGIGIKIFKIIPGGTD
jgi:hypothetical protein